MPLIVLCGFPCSGKSTRAKELESYIRSRQPGADVQILNDESLGITKSIAYSSALEEKKARGALQASVERYVSPSSYIIVDALNYIKGFRYQLYCIARAQKSSLCVVHCTATPSNCIARNGDRLQNGQDTYSNDILLNLISRFETPNSSNRWDNPLYVLKSDSEDSKSVYGELYDGLVSGPKPTANLATKQMPMSDANFLYELDQITQHVVQQILDAQSCGALPGDIIPCATQEKFFLPRTLNIYDLRKLREQFVKINRSHFICSKETIANNFVSFMNQRLREN